MDVLVAAGARIDQPQPGEGGRAELIAGAEQQPAVRPRRVGAGAAPAMQLTGGALPDFGRCALFEFDLLARNASLGVGLLPAHRRQGYGRDAVAVLLDYAFDKRNLHRVQLEVLADNDAALSAYKASGFVEEGRLREHAYTAGSFVDLVVMSVLRTDWLAARPGR